MGEIKTLADKVWKEGPNPRNGLVRQVTDLLDTKVDAAYTPGGTDVAVADGGTGASTASDARTNLGLAIGTDVQAHSAVLDATTASFLTADETKLDGIEAGADVTDAGNVGSAINGATAKTTPVDADTVGLIDSAASNVLKKLSWANIKATLKTYFDTLYAGIPTSGTWTPVVADAATGGNTGTAAIAGGEYNRIGNLVHATIRLVNIDTTGMTSGNTLHIRGLPFVVSSSPASLHTSSARISAITFTNTPIVWLASGVSYAQLFEMTSGGSESTVKVSALVSGSADIFASVDYITDAA